MAPTIPIQRPVPTNQSRKVIQAAREDVEYLNLRLLNRRARVQLAAPFGELQQLPQRLCLLAIANRKGWLAFCARIEARTYELGLARLSDIRNCYLSEDVPASERFNFQDAIRFSLAQYGNLVSIKFAYDESRIVIGAEQGEVMVFDTDALLSQPQSPSAHEATPLRVFSGAPVLDLCNNTGRSSQLLAVLRDGVERTQVELLNIDVLSTTNVWAGASETRPTAISWAPDGGQLAIALGSGDILVYDPSRPESPVSSIPKPAPAPARPVLSLTWLENSTFQVIFGASQDEPDNIYVIYSSNAEGALLETRLEDAAPPFGPAGRSSTPQVLVLRDWEPLSLLLFISDGPASEVGIVGKTNNTWMNITLDESSTPSLPLDEDMYETAVMGHAIDFTSTEPIQTETKSGEELQLPPSPILYAYASDGTIIAWHICNLKHPAYPAMVSSPTGAASQTVATVVVAAAPAPPRPFASREPAKDFKPAFKPTATSRSPTPPSSDGSDVEPDDFGGLSLGGTGARGATNPSAPSIFGSAPAPFGSIPQSSPASTPNKGTPFRPAMGFGAFTPASSAPNAFFPSTPPSTTTTTVPAFGASAQKSTSVFGNAPSTSSFGQSGFGSTSKPVFGQAPVAPAKQSSSFMSGGFGAFAHAPSAFGSTQEGPSTPAPPKADPPPKPAALQGESDATKPNAVTKPAPENTNAAEPARAGTVFGAGSFGKPALSFGSAAFGTPKQEAPKPAASSAAPVGFGGFAGFSGGSGVFGGTPSVPSTSESKGSTPQPKDVSAPPAEKITLAAASRPKTSLSESFDTLSHLGSSFDSVNLQSFPSTTIEREPKEDDHDQREDEIDDFLSEHSGDDSDADSIIKFTNRPPGPRAAAVPVNQPPPSSLPPTPPAPEISRPSNLTAGGSRQPIAPQPTALPPPGGLTRPVPVRSPFSSTEGARDEEPKFGFFSHPPQTKPEEKVETQPTMFKPSFGKPAESATSWAPTPAPVFGFPGKGQTLGPSPAAPPTQATVFPGTGATLFGATLSKPVSAPPNEIPRVNTVPVHQDTSVERSMTAAYQFILEASQRVLEKLRSVSNRNAAARQGEVLDGQLSQQHLKEVQEGTTKMLTDLRNCDIATAELQDSLLREDIQVQHIKNLCHGVLNPKFNRMAEERSLTPEQLESQEIIRHQLRDCRNLIQQLEALLASLQEGVEAQKQGRIPLKTPSLATIDRTVRLLETNLSQQQKRLAAIEGDLTTRRSAGKHLRQIERPSATVHRISSLTVSKNVASAINSEVAGQKLRVTMLSIRDTPLLTTFVSAADQVADGSSLPLFSAITEPEDVRKSQAWDSELQRTPRPSSQEHSAEIPPWDLPTPETASNAAAKPGATVGRQGSAKKTSHPKSAAHPVVDNVGVRRAGYFAPPADFSWGALPPAGTTGSSTRLPGFADFASLAKKT